MDAIVKKFTDLPGWQKVYPSLPTGFNVLLILFITYTLSQITWHLIPEETQVLAPTNSANNRDNKTKSGSALKFQHVSDAHLLGKYETVKAAPVTTAAPETRLNLTLKGVLAAIPMKNASAIISQGKNGKEDIYGIGDKVSSATVKEIHPVYIILERNGQLETLKLPKESSGQIITQSRERGRAKTVKGINENSTPSEVLSDIRKKIVRNPTSFGQYAIPVPYKENGKIRGYRLQPQKDNALFERVGLDPSDVITSVNNIKLNNPANGLKAIRALKKAKHVNLTVLRDGAEIPLNFEMP